MKRALLFAVLLASRALAHDVQGYVYTRDGTPIANATVTARAEKATTDASGYFKLTGFAEELVVLEVRSGEVSANLYALAGDPPLTITLGGPPQRPALARFQEGGRTVSGTVRLGKKPLPGGPVKVQPLSGELGYRTIADAKGRFSVQAPPGRYAVTPDEGLEPRLRWEPLTRMYEDGKEPFLVNLGTEDVTVDVELTAAPLITGRVVDHEGKPVARAAVAFEQAPEPFVRTYPDGRFAIPAQPGLLLVTAPGHSTVRSKSFDITLPQFLDVKVRVVDAGKKPIPNATLKLGTQEVHADTGELTLHLEPGEHELTASAASYLAATVTHTVERPASLDIPLERGSAITGRVRRGKTGVAGVTVSLMGRRAGEISAQTAADGTFTLDNLPRGEHRIYVSKPDELLERMLTAEAPGTIDVEFPPAGTLRGHVIDAATRKPVTDFVYGLTAEESSDSGRRRGELARGMRAADGAFTATAPVGVYELTVNATGYTPGEALQVRITEGPAAEVVVALQRGATITGRVSDDTGAPVAEARVIVMRDEREMQRSSMRVGPSTAETDAEGNFTVTGLTPGETNVVVRKQGYVLVQKTVDVEPVTRVDLVMSRGITVTGVVTIGGRPVPGMQVGASTAAVGADHQSAMTDATGRYTMSGLIPARYTFSAVQENRHAEVRDVDVTKRREVNIELERDQRASVYGTVTGIPRLPGKSVRRVVFVAGGDRGAEGQIDNAGNYRIEDAPAGAVEVVAHFETPEVTLSSLRKRVELAPGETARVDLDLTGSIPVRGRVTHASRPLAGARVTFSSEQSFFASATTRPDGTYELALASPGVYQIFAYTEDPDVRHFQTTREIRGAETIDIDIREQRLEGVVLDRDTRQPIPGAVVTLKGASAAQIAGEIITDTTGRFSLTTSAAGAQFLIASARGYAHRTLPITLGPTAQPPFTIDLARAAELRVRVVDVRTRTPLDAHLVLTDERSVVLPVRHERSPDGTTYMFSLAPGRYQVKVVVPGYGQKTVDVTAPGAVEVGVE